MRKFILALAMTFLVTAGGVIAEDSILRPDHPDSYVVKEGDTLWGIASMFLVDACALIAFKDQVSAKADWVTELFRHQRHLLAVSAITVWEIEMKAAKGPNFLERYWESQHASLQEQLIAAKMTLVPFTADMATRAARLPLHHKDPFDRGLIGTALHLRLPIISYDRQLARYEGVDLRWD